MSTHIARPVVVDSWAQKSAVKNVTLVLGLVVLTAICAQVSIPLPHTDVPLTLQTFAVLGGAAAVGAQRAVIAQTLYVGLALLGVPVLAEGSAGKDVVFGVTGGYLVGFIAASYVVGRIAQRGATHNVASTALAYVAGSAVIYTLGVGWLAHSTGMTISAAITAGMTPFLIGDALKALVAGAALPAAWKLANK